MRSVYADGALQIVRKAIPVAGLEGDVVNADDVGVACYVVCLRPIQNSTHVFGAGNAYCAAIAACHVFSLPYVTGSLH